MVTVLVEGESDRVALEICARRLDLPVPAIVPMGGAHAIARVVTRIRAESPTERLLGLVDSGERLAFSRVIGQVFVCERDLDDELIRALGIDAALLVIAGQGELGSFRILQKQPAQRGRDPVDQVRQFLHGRSGNKARYAALFAEALEEERIPGPLKGVLVAANTLQAERGRL